MKPISGRVAEDVAFVADAVAAAAAAAVAIVSVAAVRDSCLSNNDAAAEVDIFYANLRR